MRLSPRDPNEYWWLYYIGVAKALLGADEEAVTWYQRAIEINPNVPFMHDMLAASLEALGRHDEARAEARTGIALGPKLTVRQYRSTAQSDNPVYLKQYERLLQAMQKAGVPEE